MQRLMKILQDFLTEKDGVSWCPVSFITLAGSITMIVEFLYKGSVDFQGLGIGLAALGGAKAVKYMTDQPPNQP